MAEPTEEELFFIAADLTLYSNPLNKALGNASLQKKQQEAQKKEEKKEQNQKADESKKEEEEEMIASDMNKYDSPLADLDMKFNQKVDSRQVGQEKHLKQETGNTK